LDTRLSCKRHRYDTYNPARGYMANERSVVTPGVNAAKLKTIIRPRKQKI
jgi:hypothetical protein